MTSCLGNGWADNSDGETYGGTVSSSSSSSTRSSGSGGTYTASFSFDELMRLSGAGDTEALTSMFRDDSASSGSAGAGEVAWYDGNSGSKTHEVKTTDPNAKGIYDMSGNVWKLCWNIYSSFNRMARGGSWGSDISNSAVTFRLGSSPYLRNYYNGFRLVRKAP